MKRSLFPLPSIALKLLASIIPISLVGIFLTGLAAYHVTKPLILENVKKEVQKLGFEAAQSLSAFFKQRQNDLDQISESPLFNDYYNNLEFKLLQEAETYRTEIEDYLQKFSVRSGVYNGLWYLDEEGREIATVKFSKIATRKGRVAEEVPLQQM